MDKKTAELMEKWRKMAEDKDKSGEKPQYAKVYKFYRKEGKRPKFVKGPIPLEEAKSFCQLAPHRSEGDDRDFFHGFRIV